MLSSATLRSPKALLPLILQLIPLFFQRLTMSKSTFIVTFIGDSGGLTTYEYKGYSYILPNHQQIIYRWKDLEDFSLRLKNIPKLKAVAEPRIVSGSGTAVP